MHPFDLIAAVDTDWGLSLNGKIPWMGTDRGREDMSYFRSMTAGATVVMGRRTWETLSKPLPGRCNVVLSHQYTGVTIQGALTDTPVVYIGSFEDAIEWCSKMAKDKGPGAPRTMVIGGADVYRQALCHPAMRHAYITMIDGQFGCDIAFPQEICEWSYTTVAGIGGTNEYRKYYINRDELEYRDLCRRLLRAPIRPTRTGIPSRGLFHQVLRISLYGPGRERVMPLITSKATAWRMVYHELIWFLRGSTDTTYLEENKVPIWRGNSSRDYLDSHGFADKPEGYVGPIYGYQWRARGDQLAGVIRSLQTNPWDRRMLVSAWTVEDLPQMVLPPCHYAFQFHVDPDENGKPGRLNCLVNMRSADVGLGVPFNIASYALLTHMVSIITGIAPGTLSLSMADCHLYVNHIDGIREMLTRNPYEFPSLELSLRAAAVTNIDDFATKISLGDFYLIDRRQHPSIALSMAV
jgi:thymidylate synthase